MCKVIGFTNAKKLTINESFLKSVQATMDGERDGFGYAVLDSRSQLWGERYMNPNAIDFRIKAVRHELYSLPLRTMRANAFGEYSTKGNMSAIFHGRTSTNSKVLENTHPFIKNNMALIHNGVVSDVGPNAPSLELSSCDSEHILQRYLVGGITAVTDNIQGYYACMVIDANTGHLNVFRDDIAPLHMAWCRTIDSYIIATKSEMIQELAKAHSWKLDPIDEVVPNLHVTFKGNNILGHSTFESLGYASSQSSLASSSLGYELEEQDNVTPLTSSNRIEDYCTKDSFWDKNDMYTNKVSNKYRKNWG